ncbi:hypothetical protein Zmor_016342 [Zophobas morio]|uniref:2-dehydro-3-deoxy-phosphogluconate aldolase n=1 Tax=Zophobas morio TaxID=2755281 RepID=A0AA38HGX3_9CUCU|nr:hypothetical protein Zmor_016342 [Zophobas morio]
MSNIQKHFDEFSQSRISVIVRTNDYDHALKIIEGSAKGGIKFVEITLTIPNALQLIKEATTKFPELAIGAGTVMSIDDAKKSLEAGATYLVSPICDLELLK